MLIKPFHLMFIPSLIMGTIIACSSMSWTMAWIGLEVNLMSFIPLLFIKLNNFSTENAIMYFLIQAMASMMIIFIIILNSAFNLVNLMNVSMNFLIISLGLKAGVAPFHFWFPQIMSSLEWSQLVILSTWQKIAPLILLSNLTSWGVMLMIIMSAILGALMGLNQLSIKKILAFSSIINASWLMAISMINMYSWWVFFLLYSFIVIAIATSSAMYLINWIFEINFNNLNLLFKSIILLNVFSLAGIPPFTGFFIKIMVIEFFLTAKINLIIILVMILSSVIAFYFYMRLTYSLLFQSIKLSFHNFYFPPEMKMKESFLLNFSFFLNVVMPYFSYLS